MNINHVSNVATITSLDMSTFLRSIILIIEILGNWWDNVKESMAPTALLEMLAILDYQNCWCIVNTLGADSSLGVHSS